jgi:hypothetical protein
MCQLVRCDYLLRFYLDLSRHNYSAIAITNSLESETPLEKEDPCYDHVLRWSFCNHMQCFASSNTVGNGENHGPVM